MENDAVKSWAARAVKFLQASLHPPKHELNELDWKAAISPDKKRLTEHLSAFANHAGGGFLVYGINNSGVPEGIDEPAIAAALNHLANLARHGLEPPVSLDHAVLSYEGKRLLCVYVPESSVKPVHLRKRPLDAFIRCSGTTREASRKDMGMLLLHSSTPSWEDLHASLLLSDDEFSARLNVEPLLKMQNRPIPGPPAELLDWMEGERFISRVAAGGGYITNLGAIAAARRLADYPDLSRKAIRVIVYEGQNKAVTKREQEGVKGYAVGFPAIIKFVMELLPQSEVIEKALRQKRTVYPEIALREIIANALIHQDFSITGTGPLVEIYSDRIEVSNPGRLLPSKQLDRLIGTRAESRNEKLARAFRSYGICEERGSGLIKAGLQTELYGLPPMSFTSDSNSFTVTLYSPRTFAQMSATERLEACYQHAILRFYSHSPMTNPTLRERLKMPERQRSMVSALIQEAIDAGKIKAADPNNRSKKFRSYIPAWA